MKNRTTFQEALTHARLPRYQELPTLELYKDQLVELTNEYLTPFYLDERALTDTMVNNYVKLKVIASPVRKRYRREQLAQLILTCLLKKVLSIAEIRFLLTSENKDGSIAEAYDYMCNELEWSVSFLNGGKVDAISPHEQVTLLDHAVWSFAHKLCFEMKLLEKNEEE